MTYSYINSKKSDLVKDIDQTIHFIFTIMSFPFHNLNNFFSFNCRLHDMFGSSLKIRALALLKKCQEC